MIETYFAGTYWMGRLESAESCAQRAAALFQSLSPLEPTWNRWCEPGDSFQEASRLQVATDAGSLREHLERKDRRLCDGFLYGLWSGPTPDNTTSVTGSCGSESPWQPSSCVLTPPEQGPLAERVATASLLCQVIREMVLAWEPEFGLATSTEHLMSLAAPRYKAGTVPGWVMYFSRQRGTVPPLPAPVQVEPVGNLGTLVVLTPERFTMTNPEHVRLAAEVQQVLNDAGLLHPLRPLS
ncbi:hypothetical protein D7V97_08725 [Corallococcus sp. CA053C]|uniref:immunity 52 family protein n=1 Tax=Corallococcus sp. CA053C TaxID=2316732 RepID=UPI000EA39257|nr:hypothetical protein D7V97_08725 [Corallococcus sp. CA053C]